MCRIWQITIICLFLVKIQKINALSTENECMFQDTCERCLSTNINCAWCTDKKYELRYRCLTRELLLQHQCNDTEIWENEPDTKILTDTELKDYQSVGDHAVQVQPQKVYLKLVKSHPQRIKLTYRPARNNPLDLYYLMDLTWTMRDDKETLVTMGAELAGALHNLTANYRLGFGSFADKPAMPMIMPQLLENPCAAEREVCEPTYSFRHHMKLTDNIEDFVRSVNDSRVTGNLDNLEGGLDALMQVLVCPESIGWKPEARKIVILVTDGFMHFAGDGVLAGVTRRNDKQCHLTAEGEYLGALEYDYPSLEEIYRELLNRKVNVIFAVTDGVVKTYRQLSNLIQEVSNVEILSADSSNILELIRKSYESFIKRTQFFDNSPSFIKVEYETDCGGQFSILRQRNFCNDVEMGKEVDFYINVTLTDFPPDGNYNHKIRIEESSLSEYLEIDVEIQRPCPCIEEPNPTDENGRFQCTDNGYMQCGMCQCDEGWTGVICSCSTDVYNATTNEAIDNMCRQTFNNPRELGPVCSNRGECDCGTCFCFQGFIGKYCECPDCFDCDQEGAHCICGHCVCKDGWSGTRCDCKDSDDSCVGPTGEICSMRGNCECGQCECEEPYMGRFCEIGSDLDNKLCTFFEPCVICLIDQKMGAGMCENLTEICSTATERERYTYAFVTEEIDADVRCLARVEDRNGVKCDHYFTYQSLGQSENYLLIQINNCEPANYVALVGFLSISTLILGLLVIWLIMCCLRAKDRLEYLRFEEDQRNSILNMSPLYKDPIGRYEVPKELNGEDDNPFR